MIGRTKFKVGDRVKLFPESDWCKEAKEDALNPCIIIAVISSDIFRITTKNPKAPLG